MLQKLRRKAVVVLFRVSLARHNRRQFIPSEWEKLDSACLTFLQSSGQARLTNSFLNQNTARARGWPELSGNSSAPSLCLKPHRSRFQFKSLNGRPNSHLEFVITWASLNSICSWSTLDGHLKTFWVRCAVTLPPLWQ